MPTGQVTTRQKFLTYKSKHPKEPDRATNTAVQKEATISLMKRNDNWPCLEDTDGRFLPHPPDERAPKPEVIVGRIRMKNDSQANPVPIFPCSN